MGIEEIKGKPHLNRHKTKWEKRSTSTKIRKSKDGLDIVDQYTRIMFRLSEDVNRACTRWEIARGIHVADRPFRFGKKV